MAYYNYTDIKNYPVKIEIIISLYMLEFCYP